MLNYYPQFKDVKSKRTMLICSCYFLLDTDIRCLRNDYYLNLLAECIVSDIEFNSEEMDLIIDRDNIIFNQFNRILKLKPEEFNEKNKKVKLVKLISDVMVRKIRNEVIHRNNIRVEDLPNVLNLMLGRIQDYDFEMNHIYMKKEKTIAILDFCRKLAILRFCFSDVLKKFTELQRNEQADLNRIDAMINQLYIASQEEGENDGPNAETNKKLHWVVFMLTALQKHITLKNFKDLQLHNCYRILSNLLESKDAQFITLSRNVLDIQ